MAKRDDDSASDMDVGMTTAERRRRRRRGGGLRVPSDNVPRRANPPVVAPVPEDPSLAMSIAYSFSSDASDRVEMDARRRDGMPTAAKDSKADPEMPTVIDPSAPVEGQDFEMKTREMTAVDLEALGLSGDTLTGMSRNGEDNLARTDPSMPTLPGINDLDRTLRGETVADDDVDIEITAEPGDAVPTALADEEVRRPAFDKRVRLKTVALTEEDLEEVREAVRSVTGQSDDRHDSQPAQQAQPSPAHAAAQLKPKPTLPPPVRQTGQNPIVPAVRQTGQNPIVDKPAVKQSGQHPIVAQQPRTPPQPTPSPPLKSLDPRTVAPKPITTPPESRTTTPAQPPAKPPSQPLPAEARTTTLPPGAAPPGAAPIKPISPSAIAEAATKTQPLAPQDLDEVPMSIADIDVQELSDRADAPVSVPDIDVQELSERASSSGEIEISVDDSQPIPKRDKPASVPPPVAPAAASTSPGQPPPTPVAKTPPTPPPQKAAQAGRPPQSSPVKAPAPIAAAMKPPEPSKRGKPWFVDLFDEDYLRTLPFLTPQATQAEAEFVIESMGLQPGAQVLDVGCGYGRHAMELAARGYHIVGLDMSTPLLVRGGEEAHRRNLTINFVRGDMREIDFDSQFDGAYCLFSTFGYFDDETNKKTIANIARALKPGGRVLIEILNRDYIIADLPTRVWWEGDGCVVLEEVELNYFSSRIQVNRSVVFDDGRQLEQEISVRAYSLHEVGKLMHAAGFRVLEVSGGYHTRSRFFGNQSRHIIVLAERKDPTAT